MHSRRRKRCRRVPPLGARHVAAASSSSKSSHNRIAAALFCRKVPASLAITFRKHVRRKQQIVMTHAKMENRNLGKINKIGVKGICTGSVNGILFEVVVVSSRLSQTTTRMWRPPGLGILSVRLSVCLSVPQEIAWFLIDFDEKLQMARSK